MELWVVIAIGAAFFQNVRSALQKHLKGRLSTTGVTFSRFVFAVPMIMVVLAVLVLVRGYELPVPNARFGAFVAVGGISQITATALLVHLFGLRSFAVGTTFSKTETIQAALFGIVVLSDAITLMAGVALLVSLVGVVLLSSINGLRGGVFNRGTLVGIASGTAFAVSGISYRGASLSLESGDFIIRATFTLACVLAFQTVIMAIWLKWKDPRQIGRVLQSWRVSALVGLAGGLASLGWFSAMTLQNAAYVKAVGQIELLFTFAVSVLIFRERSNRREVGGIILVSLGILLLLLWK
ncbi:MAG: EamA family transporter [Paracoccaceae bacterium]